MLERRALTPADRRGHSHISADQSQSPGVLHQLSDWYLDPLPPHFVHKLYVLIQSRAKESIVYFTLQSIAAASERLSTPDRFFCVIKQYGFHVCMCAVFDVQGRDGDSPAHNESDFYFWKVVRDISAVTPVLRDVLAMQMPKIKKTLFNGKIWALGKLIIYTMICCYFFKFRNEGNNYLGHSLSSLSTENPRGQVLMA